MTKTQQAIQKMGQDSNGTFFDDWFQQRSDFHRDLKKIPHLNVVDHSYIMDAYDLNWLRYLHTLLKYPDSIDHIVAETWIPHLMKEDGTCLLLCSSIHEDVLMEGTPEYGEQYTMVSFSKILSLTNKRTPWTYSIWNDPYVGSYHQYADDTDDVYLCYGDPFDRLAIELHPPKTNGIN